MDLSGIISIAGKPGLYKVLTNNKSSLVVQSLVDGKRTTALSTHKISALEDISIYTEENDVPLREVYQSIYDKESGGSGPNHKGELAELKEYLSSILPDYDEDRVYNSDIKKLFQWYNILQVAGALKITTEEKEIEKEIDKEEE